ncbi:MAG: OmpA family protein [Hyphomicrobiaceae bacterium]|nr:OmpA family protein [Hyphomicrobiaceae bacterium]
MLFGIADTLGSGPANERLSLARAQSVESALRAVGSTGAAVAGYGEMSPVACNDTPESRNLNQRVEFWIR